MVFSSPLLRSLNSLSFSSHSGKNELFKLCLAETAAPRTAFVVGPFGAAEIFIASVIVGDFECVRTFSALDFPCQPSASGFAPILEGSVCHQLLAAPQPNIRRDKSFMGRNHKGLIFQAPVLVLLHIPTLIEITAACSCEGGGVINHRTLTFEELMHFQVGLCIDGLRKRWDK